MATARRLDELKPEDASRFGGKAVQCGVLLQAGFPVPEGIGIAFDADEQPRLPEEARAWIEARPAMRFAVRSSAADEDGAGNSFAGIHESVLDVGAGEIEEAIAACVASMSSDRAHTYRAARGLESSRGAAVLIQRMIEPLRAGVAFTADPISGDRDTIVINAAAGRGEAVVSGTVTPEEVRVRKSEAKDPLAKLMLRVEQHYGAPQDIEWCDDGATIWIVQSRPITSIGDGIEWSRANLREVLPDLPAPAIAETLRDILSDTYARFFGKLLDPKLGPLISIISGRMYFNVTQFRRLAALIGESEAAMLRSLGHPGEITAADEKRRMPRLREWIGLSPILARVVWQQATLRRLVPKVAAAMRAYHDECAAVDVVHASDEELLRRLRDWNDTAHQWIYPTFLLGSVLTFERGVRSLCADADRVLQTWLRAGERSVSSQQGMDVLRVARGEMTFEAFLDCYGHRGIYESDWSLPRFAEDPSPILAAVRAHQAAGEIPDPDEISRKQQDAWEQLRHEVRPGLRVRWLLRRIKWMYLWRERYRSEMVRVISRHRSWHLELARRFVARDWLDREHDYFALTLEDLAQDPSRYRGIAADKWRKYAEHAKIEMPLLLGSGRPARPRWADETSALQGLCISSGFVEAPVAVLLHPSEVARFPRGAILVAPATDPSWTPLFTLASGVIVEIGGTLSHAATVAREMGLPALANVRDATKILKDGMRVRLDASNGYATIV